MMAPDYGRLRAMTDDELVEHYDATHGPHRSAMQFIRDELAHREQARQTEAMWRYTRWITLMTLVVTIVTIVNLTV